MGLLFVIEGDETAKGLYVDLSVSQHEAIISEARKQGGYPLIRRTNDYYTDVLFDQDEIQPLLNELIEFRTKVNLPQVEQLITLCDDAKNKSIGIQTIAD